MKKWMARRALPLLLSIAMVMSMNGVSIYAAGVAAGKDGFRLEQGAGLCEHHPEHTDKCGYREAQPCTHEHTEECYETVTECVHTHTKDCYPKEAETEDILTDDDATPSDAGMPESDNCTHVCSEESGCIIKELNCTHEHDESCGAAAAQECAFVCEICSSGTSGEDDIKDGETEEPETEELEIKNPEPENIEQEDRQDTSLCGHHPEHTADCGYSEEDNTPCTYECRICPIEDLNAALPDEVTEDNAEDVRAQLDEILTLYRELTEEEQNQLDLSRCYALQEALDAASAPELLAGDVSASYQKAEWNGSEVVYSGETENACTAVTDSDAEVTWNAGWYVVNSTVTIDGRITVTGEVNLILADECTLTASQGITVSSDNSLTIYGQAGGTGTLTATGAANSNCAGIGGNYGSSGTITIHGGTVTATGGSNGGAGIGGGNQGKGSYITIYGGEVTATGGNNGSNGGAGIGGGYQGEGSYITIYGGEVTATSKSNGAGIGGGSGGLTTNGVGSNITISGGTVEATSSLGGAGIGGGYRSGGSVITISGGTVTATSGSDGAGIGGGYNGEGNNITISGGEVTATSGLYGAGIGGGGGSSGAGNNITISGGTVTATSGLGGAGIGGGYKGASTEFSTGDNGSAVIFASSIGDTSSQDNWNCVIFQDSSGQVYGDVTLTEDFEIPSGKTLTIPDGSSLTIPDGKTLTIPAGASVTNEGDLTIAGGELAGGGTLAGGGAFTKDLKDLTADMISVPTNRYYTPDLTETELAGEVSISDGKTILGQTFAVDLSAWTLSVTKVSDLEYTATYTSTSDPNKTISKTITLLQSGTKFEGGVVTYKSDGTPAAAFVYSDTITVKATPAATGAAPLMAASLDEPAAGQMAVYYKGVQVSAPSTVADGVHTMTVDTADLGLTEQELNQEITLTVRYIALPTMASAESTVEVTVTAAAKVDLSNNITYVNNLQDAFVDANQYATVTLLCNVTLAECVNVTTGSITLDLNGYTIEGGDKAFSVGFSSFIIKDTGTAGGIKASGNAIEVTGGTLNLEGGGGFSSTGGGCGISVTGGTVDVTGKNVMIEKLSISGSGKALLSGGTYEGTPAIQTTSGTLKSLLASYDEYDKYSAYFSGGKPIDLTTLQSQTELDGPVTVNACTHEESVSGYTSNGDSTHKLICRACGYTEAAEKCVYTFEENVGTCQSCGSALIVSVSGTDGLVYDGNKKEPTVSVTLDGTALTADTDYTVAYSNNINAGTATLTVTGITFNGTYKQNFTILLGEADIELETDKTVYTYGEAITFTFTVKLSENAAGNSRAKSRAAAKNNTIDFYCGNTRLNDTEITVTENTEQTFAYQTGGKGIPSGEQIITAVYGGSGNLNSTEGTVIITLNRKTLAAVVDSSSGSAAKTYDGTADFQNVELTLDGLVNRNDAVTAAADGTADSKDTGDGKIFTASSVTLSGADKGYYTLTSGDVSGSVSIQKTDSAVSVKAENMTSQSGGSTGTYGDTFVLTATVTGVNGEKPDGTVTFKDNGAEIKTGAAVTVTDGKASFEWEDAEPGTHKITAEFTPADSGNGQNYIGSASGEAVLEVSKARQAELSIDEVTGKKYLDPEFSLTASGGSGSGALTWSVPAGNGVLSLSSDGTAEIIGAGTVTVTVTKAGDDYYESAEAVRVVEIGKAPAPQIAWPAASGITYGQKLSDSTLTGGSTEYGDFTWTDGSIMPTVNNSGYEVTFRPSESTEKNYEVTELKQTAAITVGKADTALTVKAAVSGEAGSRKAVLSVIAAGVNGGAVPSGTADLMDITDGKNEKIATVSLDADGNASYVWENLKDQEYRVKAVYSGDDNYKGKEEQALFDTRKEEQAALVPADIGNKTYGDGDFELKIQSGGNGTGAVTWQSSDPSIVSISGSTATIHKAGVVTITVKKAGDDTYNETETSILLTIQKTSPAVSVKAENKTSQSGGSTGTYGDTFVLTATVTGVNGEKPDGTVTFKDNGAEIKTGAAVTVTDGKVFFEWEDAEPGTHKITAEFTPADSGNGQNYIGSASGEAVLEVSKAQQAGLSIDEVTGKKYLDPEFSLTASGGSGSGALTWSVPAGNGVLSLSSDGTAEIIGAGTVTVIVTKAGDGYYESAEAVREIEIGKAPAPQIAWPTASGITYGQKLSDSTLTGGSTEYGDFTWTDGSIMPTVNNSGYEVTFRPSESTEKNYEVTELKQTAAITVGKADTALTVKAAVSGEAGSRKAVLSVIAAGVNGGAVPSGTADLMDITDGKNEKIATVSLDADGNASYVWENLKDQEYRVKAVYSGDDNYKGKEEQALFDTRKQEQAALVPADIGNKTYGDGDFELKIQSGGNGTGAVTWQSSDPSTVSISGSTATIHKAGAVTITVKKAGDDTYNETETSVLLTVQKKGLTVAAVDQEMTAGGTLPDFSVGYDGFVGTDNKDNCMDTKAEATCQADGKTAGKYDIILTTQAVLNASASEKYTITEQKNGVLTVWERKYTVTVNGGTGASGSGSYPGGVTVTIDAGTKDGYQFSGWSGSVEFADKDSKTTTFVMPKQDVTVTADWKKTEGSGNGGTGGNGSSGNNGSSGGSGSSGGNGSSGTGQGTATKPTQPVSGTVTVPATLTADGSTAVTITAENITDTVQAAKNTAEKKGVNAGDITVEIHITGGKSEDSITFNLPKAVQDKIVDEQISNFRLVVEKPDITLALDLAAVAEIRRQAGGDVHLTAERVDVSTLSKESKAALGNRPAFDLKVTCINDGRNITDFGTGCVSVAIPYPLQKGETAGGVHAVYIDSNGKAVYLTTCSSYDSSRKALIFVTNHFSVYGIGYLEPAAYSDITGHFEEDIQFALTRGLLSGTGKENFSPNQAVTFGELVDALGVLAGADPDKTGSYAAWAEETGIAGGMILSVFASDRALARQEVAVIMANYARLTGTALPESRTEAAFADGGQVADYAKEAVKAMQMAGLMDGKDGNLFDPAAEATRAEVCRILHRYVMLSIYPESAGQGWTRNASGHWNYYRDGAKLTGWQTIDGLVYFFNPDGVMHEGWKQEPQTNDWHYWTNEGAAVGWKEIDGKQYYFNPDGTMYTGG